jgi:hypothetical protein
MDGLLTFREEQNMGFDPINDAFDPFLAALSYIWDRVGIDNALDLLTCLLEAL